MLLGSACPFVDARAILIGNTRVTSQATGNTRIAGPSLLELGLALAIKIIRTFEDILSRDPVDSHLDTPVSISTFCITRL